MVLGSLFGYLRDKIHNRNMVISFGGKCPRILSSLEAMERDLDKWGKTSRFGEDRLQWWKAYLARMRRGPESPGPYLLSKLKFRKPASREELAPHLQQSVNKAMDKVNKQSTVCISICSQFRKSFKSQCKIRWVRSTINYMHINELALIKYILAWDTQPMWSC
jgi:hypothetical protein